MKKLFAVFVLMFLFSYGINAQTKKGRSSNGGSRPVYSGSTHTTSHGGRFKGEQNSQSHKGGTYVNPSSNNRYGIHKKK